MPERNPRLKFTTDGGATVAELTDRRILDEINISEIGDQLFQAVATADTPKLVLDFTNVAHMSSSALGMLITLQKRVNEKGGNLRLCNIQPAIYEVFVITRLNEIFTITESREQALAGMR